MAEVKIRIRIKRGTKADWETINPVLGLGEIGWVTDQGQWFCGNAIDTYSTIFAGDGSQIWWSKKEVEDYVATQLGTVPTLQEVTDVGNTTDNNIEFNNGVGILFANTSKVKEGTTDGGNGGNKGVALVCSLDYQLKWEAGRLYTMEQNGFTIREVKSQFTILPTVNDDDTKGFIVGSRWILDNGNVYTCTDATTGVAIWELTDNGGLQSVTDDAMGGVKVDNADPFNPVVQFIGITTDGITLSGDGTSSNPLTVLTAGGVASVTDDAMGGVQVDNTDPLNPIVKFTGVTTDGVTMSGDGTSTNPLFSTAVSDTFQVLASAMDSTPAYLDTKIIALDSSILFDNSVPSALQLGVVYAPMVVLQGINADTVTINKGDPVYFDGTQGATNVLRIKKADASNSSKMPSVGVAYQTSSSGLGCSVVVSGIMTNVTTDPIDGVTPSVGQTLYVKAGGGLTTVKPTGTNLIQNVGKVGKVSGGNSGSIVVSNIQRTNDIPNIADAKIWIGNASGVPTAQSLSGDVTMANTGAVTIANDAVTYAKIQNVSSTKKLLGRVSAGAGDIEEIDLSSDGTLGGAGSSGSIVSSQSAVKNYVDVGLATKQNTLTNPVTGTGTANELTYFNATGSTVASLSTATYPSLTELSYVKGVTSAIQTQIGNKQNTLVSGTSIKTVNGASLLGSGNLLPDNSLNIMSALGSTVKATTFGFDYGQWGTLNTGGAFLSGRLQFVPFYLGQDATLTGVKILCSTTGNYTGNNYNGVGLYTYSGGTLTLVASTANDANFWKPTANTLTAKPFSATYSASAGLYYLGMLYSSSAQTTAPALPVVNIFASPYGTMDFANSAKIYGSVNSQTALPSTQAMSGVAVFTSGYLMFVY